jgi:5-methylcytosine-specific restriction enzyme subunit McrC
MGQHQLSAKELEALQRHYGEQGVPYYSLIHRGVKFNGYVGVIQVGRRLIEVLPKADRSEAQDLWRDRLIGMLRATGTLQVENTGTSQLRVKPNSVLDLYFELLIAELEQLLYHGLAKQYRQTAGNRLALKGSLQFAQHLSQNLVHRERFFVRHTTYDHQHLLHQILYEALLLLHELNTHPQLHHRIGRLLLDWPEQPRLKVHPGLFERLPFYRKTEPYRPAVQIAKMLLLNYHPDVRHGHQDVLALMFNMDRLWERFVYVSLRDSKLPISVKGQMSKVFWQPESGQPQRLRPDIVLHHQSQCFILDTKWKCPPNHSPSADDLQQLYAYLKYFQAAKAALVYPSSRAAAAVHGCYPAIGPGFPEEGQGSLLFLPVGEGGVREWMGGIAGWVGGWVGTSDLQHDPDRLESGL